MKISVQGIEVPIDVDGFTVEDWKRVMDFHVEWKGACINMNLPPWDAQAYFLSYLTQLVNADPKRRTESDWMHRINQRFGSMSFFGGYSKRDMNSPGGSPLRDTIYDDEDQ